jgi:predicted amidohydrolase YtcJ
VVLSNGAVYTVDGRRSWAEAVAVSGERIAYVGSSEGAERFIGQTTTVVDLAGRVVFPGFQNSHAHPFYAGVAQVACPLDRYSDPDAYVAAVQACASRDPDAAWIRGSGWLATVFPPGSEPHKSMLDAVVPERPVMLQSKFGHMLWVNSRALEIAGITRDTSAPSGGQSVKNSETGEPTSLLKVASAMDLVARHTCRRSRPTA